MSITDRIRLDYEESMRQAAKLDRLADRLRSRTVQGMDTAAENMVIAWQSETSEACRSQAHLLCCIYAGACFLCHRIIFPKG